MTLAEIHGKLSHTGSNISDRLEDLLTSDVFTSCKYLEPELLLIPFLSTAVDTNDRKILFPQERILAVKYDFWPRLNSCEPDLLIKIKFESSGTYCLMIEAKYLSQKSSRDSENDLEIGTVSKDQLAREYNALETASKKSEKRFLIYITAHYGIPQNELIESEAAIRRYNHNDKINLYWTSWRKISQIIETGIKNPILEDLIKLLQRKNLTHYEGFSRIKTQFERKVYFYAGHENPEYRFGLINEESVYKEFVYSFK